jgi:uncharacterized protein (TIGR02594 family)
MSAPTENLKNPLTRVWVETIIQNNDKDTAKKLQRVLVDMGQNISTDGIIGPLTIEAIKNIDNKRMAELFIKKESVIAPNNKMPSWVKIAIEELGVKEAPGKRRSNPRVEQYHDTVGIPWAKDDIPWCGSFVGFVMKKAGFQLSKYPYRALDWLNWGRSVSSPAYGAVAVKKRKGGGHVTIVVGISRDKKFIYGLGGNQNNAVTIAKYPVSVFKDFRIPDGTKPIYQIPIMNSPNEIVTEV